MLLAARTEDDVSHLEVWVYEDASGHGTEANLFVHHDLLLPGAGASVAAVLRFSEARPRPPAFPLSLAWLDCPPGAAAGEARGNFVAVGTMMPAIELWDLDVLDASEPVMVLGGEDVEATAAAASKRPGAKPSKKASRAPVLRPGSHTDAVLGVAWNGAPGRCGLCAMAAVAELTFLAPPAAEFRNVLASASADCTVKVRATVQRRAPGAR